MTIHTQRYRFSVFMGYIFLFVTNSLHLYNIYDMRELQFTDEFNNFQNKIEENVRKKTAYIFEVLQTQKVINVNIVKKLINTDFYEIRIQVNNEYRVILFTIDHEDINQATQILFLNGFMKKATKDYDKQIKKAIKILEQWKE